MYIVGAYVRFVPVQAVLYSRHIEITLRLPLELHESYKFVGRMIMAGFISDLLSDRVRYPPVRLFVVWTIILTALTDLQAIKPALCDSLWILAMLISPQHHTLSLRHVLSHGERERKGEYHFRSVAFPNTDTESQWSAEHCRYFWICQIRDSQQAGSDCLFDSLSVSCCLDN